MEAKAKRKRVLFLLLAFGLGFGASLLHVTAIIHELCHIVAAYLTGGSGHLVNWTQCETAGTRGFEFVRYAGYYGEMIVYLAFFAIGTLWKHRARGLFWFGAAHSTALIQAGQSSDFDTWMDFGTRDWGAIQALGVFYFVFGVLLVAGWFAFLIRECLYWENYEEIEADRQRIRTLEDVRKRFG